MIASKRQASTRADQCTSAVRGAILPQPTVVVVLVTNWNECQKSQGPPDAGSPPTASFLQSEE